jgi:CPA1 family monovalent cation:H+ antiporter
VDVALLLVSLTATILVFAAVARRFELPAPLLLIVIGILASFMPFLPTVPLSPELVLVGLLPPLLYAAAMQSSLVDFRSNKSAIGFLSVGLVIFTAAGVGLVAWWLLPVPFSAAFALGAVVAPPDAVAATSIARRIGLPRRIVTVLEGESLVNDATALVLVRTAIAAIGGSFSLWPVLGHFLLSAFGGLAVGLVTAGIMGVIRKRITHTATDTALSFVTPFVAYLPAEHIHASGVLAVVVAGLVLAHQATRIQSASARLAAGINWTTVQFLLENAVFLLIGLQMRTILTDVGSSPVPWSTIAVASAGVLAATILQRPIWVFPLRGLVLHEHSEQGERTPWTHSAIVAWAGMRGVVTLAAAFILPSETEHREVLVLIAMVVTAGTLLLQGSTLPWLARRLNVHGPDPREDALQEATVLQTAVAAGLAVLDDLQEGVDTDTVRTLRERSQRRTNVVWERLGGDSGEETPGESYRRLRLEMLQAERASVLEIRDSGTADHEVLSHVMAALDLEESMLDRLDARTRDLNDATLRSGLDQGGCEHLRHADLHVTPKTPHGCPDCEREGTRTVHLRLCLACGTVGCCDSSEGQHARRHYHDTGHPVIRSFEPGEAWRWCFVDQITG